MYKRIAVLFLGASLIFLAFTLTTAGQRMLSPGPLSKVHIKKVKICEACHVPFKGSPDINCIKCHPQVKAQKKAKNGIHGGIKAGLCFACHPEHKGNEKPLVVLNKNNFNHKWTNFSLAKHPKQSCFSCHKSNYKKFRTVNCSNCHKTNKRLKGKYADHFKTAAKSCLACHDGENKKYTHLSSSWFFSAKHKKTKCIKCHETQKVKNKTVKIYSKIVISCLNCHKEPTHKINANKACLSCHNVSGWKKIKVDHGGKADCLNCHQKPQGHYGSSCFSCHNTGNWKSIKFNHSSSNCSQCHQRASGHYGDSCATCHKSVITWSNISFNHSLVTGVCANCHSSPSNHYGSNCSSCHSANTWQGAKFIHPSSGSCSNCHQVPGNHYGPSCANCHSTRSWNGASFGHPGVGGIHSYRSFSCSSCHPAGYGSVDCTSCHRSRGDGGEDGKKGDKKEDDD